MKRHEWDKEFECATGFKPTVTFHKRRFGYFTVWISRTGSFIPREQHRIPYTTKAARSCSHLLAAIKAVKEATSAGS